MEEVCVPSIYSPVFFPSWKCAFSFPFLVEWLVLILHHNLSLQCISGWVVCSLSGCGSVPLPFSPLKLPSLQKAVMCYNNISCLMCTCRDFNFLNLFWNKVAYLWNVSPSCDFRWFWIGGSVKHDHDIHEFLLRSVSCLLFHTITKCCSWRKRSRVFFFSHCLKCLHHLS